MFDDATVPRRITWQETFTEIINDLDGSLTGLGPNSWASFYYPHNEQPECVHSPLIHDGLICDGTVQMRRIAFWGYTPDHFRMSQIKIARWDQEIKDAVLATNQTKFAFEQDVE